MSRSIGRTRGTNPTARNAPKMDFCYLLLPGNAGRGAFLPDPLFAGASGPKCAPLFSDVNPPPKSCSQSESSGVFFPFKVRWMSTPKTPDNECSVTTVRRGPARR